MLRRRAVVLFAVASALVVSAVAGTLYAGTPYHLTDLGTLDGFSSATPLAFNTVNGNLEVVGIAQTSDYTHAAAWYWTAATGMVNLQNQLSTDLGSVDSQATGVNASGQIIGGYNDVYNNQSPGTTDGNGFVYTIGGTATKMIVPGNTNPPSQLPNNFWVAAPTAINDRGVACGFGSVGLDPTTNAFTYDVNTNTFTNLSASSGVSVAASTINKNGWIAGRGPNLTTGTAWDALVWNGISWTDLGSLAGRMTMSFSIDSNGDVVGYSNNSTNKSRPFYCHYNGTGWDTMVNLGISGSNTGGRARSINDNGQIVGYQYVSTAPISATAYVWGTTAGSAVPLSTLVANLGGWNLQEALVIDNRCNIVGVGTDAAGNSKAFLITATAGDANLDGLVDVADMSRVLLNYNAGAGKTWSDGDFNADGVVDITDMSNTLSHYDRSVGSSAGHFNAVPEPSSLVLLLVAGSLVLAGRWG